MTTGAETEQGDLHMKALVLQESGQVSIQEVPEPVVTNQQILLKVRTVGLCGSDLNSFRGLNPLVSFPRILGHEVCATIVEVGSDSGLAVGTREPVSYETRLFVQKKLDILGSRNALPEDFRAVMQMLEARRFPVDQAVSAVVPLEEAGEALRTWSENTSRFRNILVELDHDSYRVDSKLQTISAGTNRC